MTRRSLEISSPSFCRARIVGAPKKMPYGARSRGRQVADVAVRVIGRERGKRNVTALIMVRTKRVDIESC